jgi:hypothetical protein
MLETTNEEVAQEMTALDDIRISRAAARSPRSS